MGVERSVIRWYAKRQLLLDEIGRLERQLSEVAAGDAEAPTQQRASEQEEQLARARKQLVLLGACPKSAMV